MKEKQVSDAQLERNVSGIERQLAKPLKAFGKVSLPKKGESLIRFLTVKSRAAAQINVVVTHEHHGGFHNRPTGLYSVLVQEVRGSDSRVKLRARAFEGLPVNLTAEQVEAIVVCVRKHLAAREQVELEFDAKDVERKRVEREEAERHARLKAIGKAYGIRNADHGSLLGSGFVARCTGNAFTVILDHISEAELRGFLDFWTKHKGRA